MMNMNNVNKNFLCGKKIALIGNPNSGKTTLFNRLTGSNQRVSNWPGVTVERKEGVIRGTNSLMLVDLPGIYSLSPYSPEEIITRNFLLNEKPDAIINIIDSTNLERNLYLTTQLLELDYKIILVLNMTDLLKNKGKKINISMMKNLLNVPVIEVSALKNTGMNALLGELYNVLHMPKSNYLVEIYDQTTAESIKKISRIIQKCDISNVKFNAVKIFEDDPLVNKNLKLSNSEINQINLAKNSVFIKKNLDRTMIIADQRYNYICRVCKQFAQSSQKNAFSLSGAIDKIITGKYTAIPVFLLLVFGIFFITFGKFGSFFRVQTENIIEFGLKNNVETLLNFLGASKISKSLILDAIIGGVGSIFAFLPQILILFTLLSILEDSGYMARVAFIMDKILVKIGLSGKAFVSLLMGFGCSVPAVLGTRILENKKDKNLTIFLIPFMSCTAKMPVYLLFASSFFPRHQTLIIFSLYALGILIAIFTSYLFRNSLFKGELSPFIMEIPEYRMPSLKNLWMYVWDRIKDFLERAGGVIFVATVLIWFLQSFTFGLKYAENSSQSILASLGGLIAPVFKICGFGDWKSSVSLLTGIFAKESIVSTMTVLYGLETSSLSGNFLTSQFSAISAFSFMVFVLLYTPCVAAISVIHREFKSLKLTLISIAYQIFVAWFTSALIYQIGSLIAKLFKVHL